MSQSWFEHDRSLDDRTSRRRDTNKLQRIAKDSEQQEQGQIARWLELAKKMLDDDTDSRHSLSSRAS